MRFFGILSRSEMLQPEAPLIPLVILDMGTGRIRWQRIVSSGAELQFAAGHLVMTTTVGAQQAFDLRDDNDAHPTTVVDRPPHAVGASHFRALLYDRDPSSKPERARPCNSTRCTVDLLMEDVASKRLLYHIELGNNYTRSDYALVTGRESAYVTESSRLLGIPKSGFEHTTCGVGV